MPPYRANKTVGFFSFERPHFPVLTAKAFEHLHNIHVSKEFIMYALALSQHL